MHIYMYVNRYYMHICIIYIYIYLRRGGTKASLQRNAQGFFVSALKYLEVKAGREIEKEREREERERERDR